MTILFPGVQESTVPSTSVVANANNGQDLGASAARTLVAGSLLKVPNGGLQVGTKIKYKAVLTKAGAGGVAATTFDVGIGLLGTTADAATVSFSTGTQTAVADTGILDIEATVTAISATAGHISGVAQLTHNLAATGLAVVPTVVATSSITNADLSLATAQYVGLYVTEGASNDLTIVSVDGVLSGLATGAPNV